jgi:hypothetical protein
MMREAFRLGFFLIDLSDGFVSLFVDGALPRPLTRDTITIIPR